MKYLLAVLLFAGVAVAQNVNLEAGSYNTHGTGAVKSEPVCGQYQHGEVEFDRTDGLLRDVCKDDTHMVTEREWQTLHHWLETAGKLFDVQQNEIIHKIDDKDRQIADLKARIAELERQLKEKK